MSTTILTENATSRMTRLMGLWGGYLLTIVFLLTISSFILSRPALAEVSSQPDPSVHTNGQVRAVLKVDATDTIYIGGGFTEVNGQPRKRLAAIDANTGELLPWKPRANKLVLTLAATEDGSRVFAGGNFTGISGIPRNHVAAIDASGKGAVVQSWAAGTDRAVYALTVSGDRLYMGGQFTTVAGQSRMRLAAVDPNSSTVNQQWTPSAVGLVRTLVQSPDGTRIYTGGDFTRISDQPRKKLAAIDANTGTVESWAPDPCYPVFDLEATNSTVFVAGGGTPPGCGAGGFADAFDATTAKSVWGGPITSDGDFQAVALLDGTVYYGGHFRVIPYQSDRRRPIFAAVDAKTGVVDRTNWTPSADFGVWAMTADWIHRRIYAGGEFTTINNQPQQGFAQFSTPGT